jgi:hypothetical protein
MAKRKCYAQWLGGCKGSSLEHVFTRGIFGNTMVETIGLPIPEGKRIGIDGAGARILCEVHNSQLNVLDDEIVKLSTAANDFLVTGVDAKVELIGIRIERWFLKFIVGTAEASWLPGGHMAAADQVVRQLFGLEPLDPNFALYGLSGMRRDPTWNKSVSAHFLRQGDREVDIALCVVNEIPLLFCAGVQHAQEALRSAETVAGYDVRQVVAQRHPEGLTMKRATGSGKLTIEFKW